MSQLTPHPHSLRPEAMTTMKNQLLSPPKQKNVGLRTKLSLSDMEGASRRTVTPDQFTNFLVVYLFQVEIKEWCSFTIEPVTILRYKVLAKQCLILIYIRHSPQYIGRMLERRKINESVFTSFSSHFIPFTSSQKALISDQVLEALEISLVFAAEDRNSMKSVTEKGRLSHTQRSEPNAS